MTICCCCCACACCIWASCCMCMLNMALCMADGVDELAWSPPFFFSFLAGARSSPFFSFFFFSDSALSASMSTLRCSSHTDDGPSLASTVVHRLWLRLYGFSNEQKTYGELGSYGECARQCVHPGIVADGHGFCRLVRAKPQMSELDADAPALASPLAASGASLALLLAPFADRFAFLLVAGGASICIRGSQRRGRAKTRWARRRADAYLGGAPLLFLLRLAQLRTDELLKVAPDSARVLVLVLVNLVHEQPLQQEGLLAAQLELDAPGLDKTLAQLGIHALLLLQLLPQRHGYPRPGTVSLLSHGHKKIATRVCGLSSSFSRLQVDIISPQARGGRRRRRRRPCWRRPGQSRRQRRTLRPPG